MPACSFGANLRHAHAHPVARMARVWNRCAARPTHPGVAQRRLAGTSQDNAVGWLDSVARNTLLASPGGEHVLQMAECPRPMAQGLDAAEPCYVTVTSKC